VSVAGVGVGVAAGVAVGVALLSSSPFVGAFVGASVVGAGDVAVAVDCGDDEVASPLLGASPVDTDPEIVGDGLAEPLGVLDGGGVVGGGVVGGGVVGGGVVGGGVDVEVDLSVSHCQIDGAEFTLPETTPDPLPGGEARACCAMAAVTTNPAAVVSKTPPALRPIDAGRTRAKHM
jgi:hypothetical protein